MKKIAFLILGIGISIVSTAQIENALLWEISGQNISKPSYLYGTIHLLPKDKFNINDKIKKAIIDCDRMVMEVDLNIPLKQKLYLAQEMVLPYGKTFKDYLSEEEYQEFETYLVDSLNIRKGKMRKIIRFKPFFASAILLRTYYKKIESFEMEFSKLAKKNKMVFGALETIEEQMDMLKDISIEEQFEDINTDVSSISEFDKMVDCYMNEDLECLDQLISETDMDDFEATFLNERNIKWIPKIEKYMQSSPSFIAVGAAHLIGDKGVIQLLRNKGYILTPKILNP